MYSVLRRAASTIRTTTAHQNHPFHNPTSRDKNSKVRSSDSVFFRAFAIEFSGLTSPGHYRQATLQTKLPHAVGKNGFFSSPRAESCHSVSRQPPREAVRHRCPDRCQSCSSVSRSLCDPSGLLRLPVPPLLFRSRCDTVHRRPAAEQHRLQARGPAIPLPLHLGFLAAVRRDQGRWCHHHGAPTDPVLRARVPQPCRPLPHRCAWRWSAVE